MSHPFCHQPVPPWFVTLCRPLPARRPFIGRGVYTFSRPSENSTPAYVPPASASEAAVRKDTPPVIGQLDSHSGFPAQPAPVNVRSRPELEAVMTP